MSDANESQKASEANAASAAPTTSSEPIADPDDVAPPLVSMIASIRAAVARGAPPAVRTAGANACRAILTVLTAKPGQPLAETPQAPASSKSPLGALLSQPGFLAKLATMSREDLIGMLQQVTGTAATQSQPRPVNLPRYHLLQIPRIKTPGNGT